MIHAFKELRLTNNSVKTSGVRLMVNGESGAFLSDLNNVSGALSTRLTQTGIDLSALITASAGAVSSINGKSGVLNLTGVGNVTVVVDGQTITISGQDVSGASVSYVDSTFATIANLGTTGSNLYNNIVGLSGKLDSTGSNLQNQINAFGPVSNIVYTTGNQNIGGAKLFSGNQTFYDLYPSGVNYTGVSGLVYRVGISGQFYINDTGNQVSIDFYNRTLSGTWNVQNLVQLSSTGSYLYNTITALSGKLDLTGSNLQTSINTLTTNLGTTGSNLYNYIVGLSGKLDLTGSNLQNSINTLTTNLGATGSMIIGLSGVVNSVITNLTNTGANLLGYIQVFSGNSQNFLTLIPTGIDTYFIQFPLNFLTIPKIIASIEVTGDILYSMNVRARTISGYSGIFSDTIQEISGVYVHTYATVNN